MKAQFLPRSFLDHVAKKYCRGEWKWGKFWKDGAPEGYDSYEDYLQNNRSWFLIDGIPHTYDGFPYRSQFTQQIIPD